MGGCDRAEMRRPAIRSTAHDPRQIDGLVREGRRSVSGMTGLCPPRTKPPMGQSSWGCMCLVEGGMGFS